MSIKQINSNINPHGNLKPRKTPQPLRKISITPHDKIFSPPLRMKSLTV